MKNEKKRKNKLKSLVLILFLTIIMFGTSTYAWFTANQTVTVSTINMKVSASNGLQISANAAAWKTILQNEDITTGYTDHKNQLPAEVEAVSTDGSVTSGKLNMFYGTIGSDAKTGAYTIESTKETDAAGTTGKYVAFDMFLKVDKEETVYLTTASGVSSAEGKGLQNAARVGFVVLGNAASSSAASALQALTSASPKVIIWEPNADTHTAFGTAAATEYGINIGSNATGYWGLKTETSKAEDLATVMAGGKADLTNAVATGGNITLMTTPTSYYSETGAGTYREFLTLQPGVTKIRVYMWIEGQDIDCENNASGSGIDVNLQFSLLTEGKNS